MPSSTIAHACVLENKFNLALHVNTIKVSDHSRHRNFRDFVYDFCGAQKGPIPVEKSVAERNWSEGNKCLFNVQITVAGLWELIRPGFCFLGADQLRSWVCQRQASWRVFNYALWLILTGNYFVLLQSVHSAWWNHLRVDRQTKCQQITVVKSIS